MRIDAHQHFWSIARDDYGWITPKLPVLFRDFLPEHLYPELKAHQMNKTIVVQAAATLAETEFILQLSESDETIIGVVGWLDLEHPEWLEHFNQFKKHPKFVGFRLMIQEMKEPEAVLQPNVTAALALMAELDFPVDLLAVSHQLPYVIKLLKLIPNLRAVLNHLGKPLIAQREWEPWKSQLIEIASFPKLYCKLSGMVTEADHLHWKQEDFTAYIQHTMDVFGVDRVMFGSDWPVCLLAASYSEVVEVLTQALPDAWSETEKTKLFGSNAAVFYKLNV
jgi:L-fuconolactonase